MASGVLKDDIMDTLYIPYAHMIDTLQTLQRQTPRQADKQTSRHIDRQKFELRIQSEEKSK